MSTNSLINAVQSAVDPRGSFPGGLDGIGIRRERPVWIDRGNLLRLDEDFPDIDTIDVWCSPDSELNDRDQSSLDDPAGVPPITPYPTNIDSYAYYLPFHFYRYQWGIYVRASGIFNLARELAANNASSANSSWLYIPVAFRTLFAHEAFHFFSELAISRLEFLALHLLTKGDSYYKKAFLDQFLGEKEEALANAYALRKLRGAPNAASHPFYSQAIADLVTVMSRQGPGYRDFGKYVENSNFSRGISGLVHDVRVLVNHAAVGVQDLADGKHYYSFGLSALRSCPVYLVRESGYSTSIGRAFPRHQGIQIKVHTHEHPPAHVHIFDNHIPLGGYSWPALAPVHGSLHLAGEVRRRIDDYLEIYADQIADKVAKVFSATE